MTNPNPDDPGAALDRIIRGQLGHAPVDPPTPPQPRLPQPNPAQGTSGTANPIPDPHADARAFVDALQTYAAQGPTGGWQDLYTQTRARGY